MFFCLHNYLLSLTASPVPLCPGEELCQEGHASLWSQTLVPCATYAATMPAGWGGWARVPSLSHRSLILWSSLCSAPTPCQG